MSGLGCLSPMQLYHRERSRSTNRVYQITQDDATKWTCEFKVEKIFMDNSEKLDVEITHNVVRLKADIKENCENWQKAREWRLRKQATLPSDCNMETVSVELDPSRCIVQVNCDKIEGEK